jgi:MFS family permease
MDQVNYDEKRWTVLIVSCLVNICIGTGYVWSVFAGPWAEYLGVKSTAIAFTICQAIGPITMIRGGKINDTIGPKWVIFVGGILFGGGVFTASFSTSLGFLVFGYGIVMGFGMGLIYSCTIGNSVKFFPDKRGLVGGLTTATYGLGSVLLSPIAQKMVDTLGIVSTFRILGMIYLAVICGGAFFVLKCPEGYTPAAWVPPAPKPNVKPSGDKNWHEMIKDPIFYIMLVMLLCGAFFGLMMISQAKGIAMNMIGWDAPTAALTVSALALFNAAGRVACGWISDIIGRVNTLVSCMVLALFALFLIYKAGDPTGANATMFIVGLCAVGFCFGAFMGVYPGFTADQFGPKNNSVNYGFMFIGFALAGILGPMIMSNIFVNQGTYLPAFLIAMGFACTGIVFSFVFRAATKKKI